MTAVSLLLGVLGRYAVVVTENLIGIPLPLQRRQVRKLVGAVDLLQSFIAVSIADEDGKIGVPRRSHEVIAEFQAKGGRGGTSGRVGTVVEDIEVAAGTSQLWHEGEGIWGGESLF